MAKHNVKTTKPVTSPVTTTSTTARTFEGGHGYTRTVESELFLLAVSYMGEDTFYEKSDDRDTRFKALIRQVAMSNPDWLAGFIPWLRNEANMRTASVVAAAEYARSRMLASSVASVPTRQVISSAMSRADEPGEMLAYWLNTYGRPIPKPVKRGVADAAKRLYNEYSLLKYDTPTHGIRFADVVDLTHPNPATPGQDALFKFALERRHNRDELSTGGLPMVATQSELRAYVDVPHLLQRTDFTSMLREAGFTWEDALSLWGGKVDKRQLWEALIPTMGYMALLRNLRNFDEAGVSDKVARAVCDRLAAPEQVMRSRQFPFRFLSAYEQAPSLRWGQALDTAMRLSMNNLPALPGRSLVLIDTSGSMSGGLFGMKSKMAPGKAAAVFGVALSNRNPGAVDVFGFADGVFAHPFRLGASLLPEVDGFLKKTGTVGHGTDIWGSLRRTFQPGVHTRIIVITDMQTVGSHLGQHGAIPEGVPFYGFNLGGYKVTAAPFGAAMRHEFGGLTDHTFKMIPLLEAGHSQSWPWMQ
jgi:hypothetical protein